MTTLLWGELSGSITFVHAATKAVHEPLAGVGARSRATLESPPTQTLEEHVDSILEAPNQGFSFTVRVQDVLLQHLSGSFSASKNQWQAKAEITNPEDAHSFVMRTRSVADGLWLQMAEWPAEMRGCWLQLSPGMTPVGFPGLTRGEPKYFSLLGAVDSRGNGEAPNTWAGTVALGHLEHLTGKPQLIRQFAKLDEPGRSVAVPVTIDHADQKITTLTIEGRDMVVAFAKSNVRLNFKFVAALNATVLQLGYFDPVTPTRVKRPHKEKISTMDGPSCRPGLKDT